MIRDLESMKQSVLNDAVPPEGISDELRALWYVKKGEWEVAHDITQEIGTKMGS